MGILNFKKKESQYQAEIEQLKKQFSDLKESHNARNDLFNLFNQSNGEMTLARKSYPECYVLFYNSDTYRTIIQALKNEIFRKGINIEPTFTRKCDSCLTTYDFDVDSCEKCNNNSFIIPQKSQKDDFTAFLQKCNLNNQTMQEVLSEIEQDLDVLDTAYLGFMFEYSHVEGVIIQKELHEVLRFNPAKISSIKDELGRIGFDDKGKIVRVCIDHRDAPTSLDVCSRCKNKTYLATHKGQRKSKDYYYVSGEVLELHKFNSGIDDPYPPALTLYNKVSSLIKQDELIRDTYTKQRMPKGMLFVSTKNPTGLQKAYEWILEKVQKNPNYIYPMAVENESGSSPATFINFMSSLSDMQFVEQREEYRRVIGAFYGVSPVFQNDVSTSGGLNNEGLQITVTNRAVEFGQSVYNTKVLPIIGEAFGLTDFYAVLACNEEEDKMAVLQREAQKIANAKSMQDLGLSVKLEDNSDELDFSYSGELTDKEQVGLFPKE